MEKLTIFDRNLIKDSKVFLNYVTNIQIKGRNQEEVEEELNNITKAFGNIYTTKDDFQKLEDHLENNIADLYKTKANKDEINKVLGIINEKLGEFKQEYGSEHRLAKRIH